MILLSDYNIRAWMQWGLHLICEAIVIVVSSQNWQYQQLWIINLAIATPGICGYPVQAGRKGQKMTEKHKTASAKNVTLNAVQASSTTGSGPNVGCWCQFGRAASRGRFNDFNFFWVVRHPEAWLDAYS